MSDYIILILVSFLVIRSFLAEVKEDGMVNDMMKNWQIYLERAEKLKLEIDKLRSTIDCLRGELERVRGIVDLPDTEIINKVLEDTKE